jgi:hypothetical protein
MSGLRRGARRPTTAPPPTVARLEWAHRPFTTTPSARWTASVRPTAPPLPTRLPRRAHCLKGARGRVCVFAYGVGLSSGTAVDRRYRPGAYVRIILDKIPCEFVEGFDPRMPVIVGGLLPTEDTLGFMQVGGCRQTETAGSLKRLGTPPPPPRSDSRSIAGTHASSRTATRSSFPSAGAASNRCRCSRSRTMVSATACSSTPPSTCTAWPSFTVCAARRADTVVRPLLTSDAAHQDRSPRPIQAFVPFKPSRAPRYGKLDAGHRACHADGYPGAGGGGGGGPPQISRRPSPNVA